MISNFLDSILSYLKSQAYWEKVRGLVTLLFLYVAALVLAYQFLDWEYGLRPSLSLYLTSYIVKEISLTFLALGLIFFLLGRLAEKDLVKSDSLRALVRLYLPWATRAVVVVSVVFLLISPVFFYLSPNKVSHIRIKFLADPTEIGINQYALVYLLYELNKRQKNWFYEVDFDLFNPRALSSTERKNCEVQNAQSCYAELLSKGKPFIGITSDQLGQDHFWQNNRQVSVVSTYDWQRYSPPSIYEFLIYSIIVQSIVIHLNAHCSGLPGSSFEKSRVSYGDLFQFSPRRNEMKASILAAHLNRNGQELLLNCFGAEYMSICATLLTLEWLHTERIKDNLEKAFKVSF